jgi:ornithine cyclodeaminase/alanine dehydrogenase-like protein (mu-crystallin family)
MEEKKLTPAEERELLKEKFKKEMLEDRAKMEALRRASLANKATNLLEQLESQLENPTDDSDLWLEKIKTETAVNEATVDMVLEKFKQEHMGQSTKPTPSVSTHTPVHNKTLGDEELLTDPTETTATNTPASSAPSKSLGDEEL